MRQISANAAGRRLIQCTGSPAIGEFVDDQAEGDAHHPHVLGQCGALIAGERRARLAHAGCPGVHAEQAAGERPQSGASHDGRHEREQQRRAERDLGSREELREILRLELAALGLSPAQDADLDDWEQMIDTNCKGLAYCTRAILPGMVARRRGHVINLGSVAGTYPYPGGNAYGGTKAFVHQFSLNLRSDLHGTGVRVTCIEPGMADTEFSIVRFSGDQAKADAVYVGMQPLTADDIAESVYWAATLPPHVNVNTIELMPVAQSFTPFQVARDSQNNQR
jgi:NAD(P)-dependent dehydrogenase (short-subunit alcohol dehydrogenase family)